jgi:pimeloyl-ACP methyl ester carboxylesterase
VRTSGIGFGGCFADPEYGESEFRRLFIEPMLASPAVFEAHMALMQSVDFEILDGLSAVHARIHAPTQLIWGTRDPFFPIELARKMTSQFAAGAVLDEIPGAKLFAHEDHPREFATLALRFLDRQLAAESRRQSA